MPNCPVTYQAEGSRGLLGYIEEGDGGWGSLPAAGYNWTGFRFNSESLGQDINSFTSNEIRSDRMTAAVIRGNRRPEGDVSFELGPNSHNLLLRHLLGGSWSTSGVPGAYTHTLTGGSSLPCGGLTFVKGFADIGQYLIYTGGRVDNISFDIGQEGFITSTARLLFKEEQSFRTNAPYNQALDYPTGDPYEANLTEWYVIAYNGAATDPYAWSWGSKLTTTTAGRFSIANGLDGNSYAQGSNSRYYIPAGRRAPSGSFNGFFIDPTMYNRYVNGTALSLRCKMTGASGYSHDWIFPNVRFNGPRATPAVAGEQGIRQDLPFQSIRHEALGYDVIVKATNDELITLY